MWLSPQTGCGSLVSKAVFCLLLTAYFHLEVASEFSCSTDTEHNCNDGNCISKAKVCDGTADCDDGSDEFNCDFLMCRKPDWFKCNNGKCISSSFVCDDSNDCGDWSDEAHDCKYEHLAGVNVTCNTGEFKCHDGMCIPFDWVCNGRNDCPDGSDEEQNCDTHVCDGFHCKSGQCIIAEFRCDGSLDCADGSDEDNCPKIGNNLRISMTECLTEKGYYACKDGVTCIPLEALCNNHTDCLGGDDEGPNCSTNSNKCESAGCSHVCHISPEGAICSCPSGYKMKLGSTKECEDIDECEIYGTCGQRCHNWQGGHACSCENGYVLASDDKSCIAESGSEATLVYSTSKEIRMYTLTSQHLSRVQSKQSEVVAVAYDGSNIYWSSLDSGKERIMKSKDTGSNKKAIASSGLKQPEDMAWDWVTRTIYFTDSGMKTISACTSDGPWCSILVNTITDSPRGIVVVPQLGTMFWTDWGSAPHIATAGMDGSNPHVFIREELHWPSSIALDFGNKRLYWADAKYHFIESVKLDGSDRRVVLKLPVKDAYSIAIFENRLFWSNYRGKEISSCDKFTGKNHTSIITERKSTILGVHIYHPALQPKIRNPCEEHGCSHMCFLAPKGNYRCGCPANMYLERDNYTCSMKSEAPALLVAAGNKLIKVQPLLLGNPNITQVPLANVQSISALTYDSHSNAAIISDSVEKKIISLNLKKLRATTLIDSQIGNVVDMEYDSAGRNLYWCDFERQVIEVYSFTTKERVVLVRDLHGDYPVSIAISPTGSLFVGLTSSHHHHMDSFSLDGKAHTHVMEDLNGPPTGLTFHKGLHRIFWVDDSTGVFQSTDDEGLDKHEWRSERNEPISLAALGPNIFWTSKTSSYLYWADVHTGLSKTAKLKLDVDGVSAMFLATIDEPLLDPHSCQVDNGGCSHICFAFSTGVKCGCPMGMHLMNDGHTCTTPKHCSRKEFRCTKDDLCIPKSLRCNGHTDCESGEDEEDCSVKKCEQDSFSCKNGDCIFLHQRCDGHPDCEDKSDEEDCRENIVCDTETQYTCYSGECIARTMLCDGIKDCYDGSDELNCLDTSCSAEEFRCNDGMCIASTWECDGAPDCKDGSDEHSSCSKMDCLDTDFTCANGQCIDKKFVCDGQDDCGDGSDEVCKESRSRETDTVSDVCPEGSYKCESGQNSKVVCLSQEAKCNGIVECPFGDDESGCGCGDEMFECRDSKRCITKVWQCDGTKDCPDGSDEEGCTKEEKTNSIKSEQTQDCEEFTCGSGECLRLSKVCNGKPHCPDGSDEGGKCEKACTGKNNPCSQICQKTPKGPRCSCNHGYQLSGDGRTCLDINECETDSEICSHFCRNTPGSFVCMCSKGYSLRSDRHSCKATGGSLDIVFVTNEEIRKFSMKTKRASSLTSHTGLTVSGLAVDAHNHHLYWSTAATGKLTRLSQANEVEKQIEKIVEKPKKLAFDWVTEKVFVVDQLQFPTIKVCDINEEKCASLLTAKLADEVTCIVLDPAQGFIFWSELSVNDEKRPKSVIWRANMDGQNATAIVQSKLSVVSGLALDLVKKRIYWTDQGNAVVEFASYEGSRRQLLPIKELQRPVGLALFEDDIYWMDGGSGKLSKKSLKYPYAWKHVELHAYDAVHFQLVHEALQPKVPNECSSVNCNEGLCVLTPNGAKCVCDDGKNCLMSVEKPSNSTNEGHSFGALLASLFLTITAMVAVAFAWYIIMKRQGKRLDSFVNFKNLQFENNTFGDIISHSIRFRANKLDPREHQFTNPGYKKQSSGFEQQPLKSVVTKDAEVFPSVRRTIPVEIPSSPSSSAGSPPSEMSPSTCSPNACLIPIDN